jgi:hypothetical protein
MTLGWQLNLQYSGSKIVASSLSISDGFLAVAQIATVAVASEDAETGRN